jgi:hypothetical protein
VLAIVISEKNTSICLNLLLCSSNQLNIPRRSSDSKTSCSSHQQNLQLIQAEHGELPWEVRGGLPGGARRTSRRLVVDYRTRTEHRHSRGRLVKEDARHPLEAAAAQAVPAPELRAPGGGVRHSGGGLRDQRRRQRTG